MKFRKILNITELFNFLCMHTELTLRLKNLLWDKDKDKVNP